jgi:hypothetical protein
MKKILVCLLALTPFMAFAQDENPPLVRDFYKGIRAIPKSFALTDHVNIMQLDLDNENFDITAVNDQMQVIWKTPLKGYVISTSKFKDKILAVASTEYSLTKKNNNTFKAYLLDPATGNVLIEKVIFDGKPDYLTFPFVFTGEGGFFKFAVRQCAFERRLHVAMPSLLAIASVNKYERQYNQTTDFDVIDFDDKLEPINKFKPVITTGVFIGADCSKTGDMFTSWFDNGKVIVVKYDQGKNTPSNPIASSVTLDKDVLDSFGIDIIVQASKKNNNVAFYALAFRNADKETELGIGKLDFSTGKEQYVNEVFTKDHVKGMKKTYIPVNKKMHSLDLGSIKALNVRTFYQSDDRIIVALTSTSYTSGMSGGTWDNEYNIVVNCFDQDLNLKFQQIIPTSYSVPERHLPIDYHFDRNRFYVLSNDKTGMTTLNGTYSSIDLATGKCDKM